MSLNATTAAAFREAIQAAQLGNFSAARQKGEAIHTYTDGDGVVSAFLGMLCCQTGDLVAGIRYLREALKLNPTDVGSATNLTTALIDTNASDDALEVCTVELALRDPSAQLWRLRGYILQLQKAFNEAATAYEHVVAINDNDIDAWNNLGNARVGAGDYAGGIAALRRAIEISPDVAPIRLNFAGALIDAQQFDEAIDVLEKSSQDFADDPKPLIELSGLFQQLDRVQEALNAIEHAARVSPDDADLQVRLGELRLINWITDGAEEAFQRALVLVPIHRNARLQLGILLEQSNRVDDLRNLIEKSIAVETDAGIVKFLDVLICRREQRFEDGLELLKTVPDDIDPAKRGQLEGEFLDRLGFSDRAFKAFKNVNVILQNDPSQPIVRAALYRSQINNDLTVVTPQWYRSWMPIIGQLERPAPVFLVGFPRSGTTLLDTILMGHPKLQIMEERPALRRLSDRIGSIDMLGKLDVNLINSYRNQYYDEVSKYIDHNHGKTLVDKFPLYLNKVPAISRIFPDAKFILAVRHPYDVALSCYITSFRLNNAMCNFLDMENIIQTYDITFKFWEKCRSILPMNIHTTYYENIVNNAQYEFQKLLPFLDVDQDVDLVDHRQTAIARGVISTASYSQVLEPIYSRGSGRWKRYKPYMFDAISKLEPWARHWGYSTN